MPPFTIPLPRLRAKPSQRQIARSAAPFTLNQVSKLAKPAPSLEWKGLILLRACDIHWNPVRIIQRFGRVGRIGSPNEAIQLVNSWPDLSLDESLNHRPRPERLPHGPRPHRQQGPLRTHARLCQQFNPATQGGRRMDHGPDLLVDLSSLPLFLVVHFQRSNQLVSHFAGFLKNKFVCGASMDHKNHGVSFPSKY